MESEKPPTPPALPLTTEEVRVLASLVEKEATVPETYPLTLNALRSACNQSSSRDPVVDYDDRTVHAALDSLKARRLLRFVHPGQGARTTRYRQVLDERLGLERPELALLAVLALRGPQTVGELRQRAERLHQFASLGEVEEVLGRLARRDEPLVVHVPRRPGQKDDRWAHLLAGEPDLGSAAFTTADPAASRRMPGPDRAPEVASPDDDARLAALEGEVAALRHQVARLYELLGEDPPAG
jgi:uncharacterized protein